MNNSMKIRTTMLAAAVALACGSAVAGDKESGTMDTTSDQYQTQTDPANQPYPATEQTDPTQGTEGYDNQSEPYGDEMADQQNTVTPPGQSPADRTTQDQATTWDKDQDRTAAQDDSQWNKDKDGTAAQDNSQWNKDKDHMASKGKDVFTEEFASDNDLGEFVKAIEAAGLTDALADGTEYTIFAPTDEAFANFKEEKGDDWSAEENVDELRKILRSHIVVGTLDRDRVKSLDSAQVLTGSVVEISDENDELKIGDAKVSDDEIELAAADNITIYTIDKVIDPSTLSERSAATSMEQDSEQTSESDTSYSEYEEEDEAAE